MICFDYWLCLICTYSFMYLLTYLTYLSWYYYLYISLSSSCKKRLIFSIWWHRMKQCASEIVLTRNIFTLTTLCQNNIVHFCFTYLGVGAFRPISSFCWCNKNLFFFFACSPRHGTWSWRKSAAIFLFFCCEPSRICFFQGKINPLSRTTSSQLCEPFPTTACSDDPKTFPQHLPRDSHNYPQHLSRGSHSSSWQ